ncbi:MAG: hypothetical protein VKJ27_10450 [Synechocystis sp.]|nr:hypothetical protein [Synechocystis sp.]
MVFSPAHSPVFPQAFPDPLPFLPSSVPGYPLVTPRDVGGKL